MAELLPAGLQAYRRSIVFDQDSMPAGLRANHRTRAGVWAVITVLDGRLRLRTFDPPQEALLDAAHSGIAAPEQPHEVEPDGAVRFFLEFYRASEAAEDPHIERNASDGGVSPK